MAFFSFSGPHSLLHAVPHPTSWVHTPLFICFGATANPPASLLSDCSVPLFPPLPFLGEHLFWWHFYPFYSSFFSSNICRLTSHFTKESSLNCKKAIIHFYFCKNISPIVVGLQQTEQLHWKECFLRICWLFLLSGPSGSGSQGECCDWQ